MAGKFCGCGGPWWPVLHGSARRPAWLAWLTGHIPPGQFGRYLAVGLWNTLFGYSTYAALTALLDPVVAHSYILAVLISSPLNITVAFLGYKWFVFKTKGNYLREWSRCMAVYLSGILIAPVVLPIVVLALRSGVGLTRSAPYVAGALLTGFGVIYNFVGNSRFSFRAVREPKAELTGGREP